MSVSPNVVIMTTKELDDFKNEWFQKGIKRGRLVEFYMKKRVRLTNLVK